MTSLSMDEKEAESENTETEQHMAELWKEVLQTADLPFPTDNFFALGGTSIDMVAILFRIQEDFSVELPHNAVFVAPSLRALSEFVDSARARASS